MARAEPAVLRSRLTERAEQVAALARPVSLAREQVLPLLPGLAALVPDGALRRGSTLAIVGPGATSLGLALAAGPSQAGGWTVAIGLPALGLQAAAELGVSLARLVLVAVPTPQQWAPVVATALDGFDVVLLRGPRRARLAETRRLQARARQRGPVLVALGATSGLEADLMLRAGAPRWEGVDAGSGHLRARRIEVEVGGRRARTIRRSVWLPDAEGRVQVAEPVAPVVELPARAGRGAP
jgi:hypothetical protein